MNVICRRALFEKAARHADAKSAIQTWFEAAVEAEWYCLEDIRKTYPATGMVGKVAIFNIKGDRYLLIVRMVFAYQRIYIKEFLTHAGYDRGAWKKWLP